MLSGKFIWFVVALTVIFKDSSCLSTIQNVTEEPQAIPNTTPVSATEETTTETAEIETTTTNSSNSRDLMLKYLYEDLKNVTVPMHITPTELFSINSTITTDCRNESYVNLTCLNQFLSDTFNDTDLTKTPGFLDSPDGFFVNKPQKTAAIAAGVFLISAVMGYFSCVWYRQFLQRKYGNSQILIGEEVYDTSDLRYFEI